MEKVFVLDTVNRKCTKEQMHDKLTPAASDSNKHEKRGSSCDGTR